MLLRHVFIVARSRPVVGLSVFSIKACLFLGLPNLLEFDIIQI